METLFSEDKGLGYSSGVGTLPQSQRLRGDVTEGGNEQQVKDEQSLPGEKTQRLLAFTVSRLQMIIVSRWCGGYSSLTRK